MLPMKDAAIILIQQLNLLGLEYFLAIDLIAHMPYCNIIIRPVMQRIAELGSNCNLYSF